jgi:predicted permease
MLRLAGTFRQGRSDADLREELRFHLEQAEDDAARRRESPQAGRVRAGSLPSAMEAQRDQSRFVWIDALRADIVFGWRQLRRRRTANGVAILSLALAIGATTGAYRLVNALLLRPLPVADPSRLFVVTTASLDAHAEDVRDDFDYPTYREYARTIADRADVLVVGMAARLPIMVPPGDEPEPVFRQYVSGNLFGVLGLKPALGRLLTPADDDAPGTHRVAVLGYDYWTRRFAADPEAIGRVIRVGNDAFDIVGVAPRGFVGTEPGSVVDLFLPATMNTAALESPGWSWFRLWMRPRGGESAAGIEQTLRARFPKSDPHLVTAASGVSGAQKTFRRPLVILAALAALVLLVACANVATLMLARTIAREREMALRLSFGAGRVRLVQLMLIESLMLAGLASAMGAVIASYSVPFVLDMLAQPDRPFRVVLDSPWRSLGFGSVVTILVTALFGLGPALSASFTAPVGTLKAANARRTTNAGTWLLIGVQVALSVFLLVAAALFGGTLDRLLARPLGFAPERVLLVSAETPSNVPASVWIDAARQLRAIGGVDSAAVAGWAPLSGNRWRGQVRVPGVIERAGSANLVDVGPSYFEALRIAMRNGRDFAPGESAIAIVNEAFARAYFDGANPIGRRVMRQASGGVPVTIVGLVADAVYLSVRDPVPPTMYLPLDARGGATFIVRGAADMTTLSVPIRRVLADARPKLSTRGVQPLTGLVEQQLLRERLLAVLSVFFAVVGLATAGLGLYGVLNGTVVRQRREIGIRMALGARATDVVESIVVRTSIPVVAGVALGLAAGIAFGRTTRSLLFETSPGEPASVLLPLLALGLVAVAAALPPAVRASRVDPAQTLRAE